MTGVLDKNSKPSNEEIEKIPSFIFCRWLSGNPATIMASNQINYYDKIPIVTQYKMIKTVFAGKIKFIPYPKNVDQQQLKNIEYLTDYFKISEEKAREYLEFISEDELNSIIQMYEEMKGN